MDIASVKERFFKKDYSGCIREGKKLLPGAGRNKRNLDELYYLMGLCYLKTEDYEAGLSSFKKIKEDFAKSRFREDSQLGAGDCYFAKGDFALAAHEYKQLLADYPQTKLKPAVYYRLSQLGERSGDSQQQREYSEKLKREFPKSPESGLTVKLFPDTRMAQVESLKTILPDDRPSQVERVSVVKPDIEGIYCVQVGAFSKELNARNLAQKLKDKSYPAYVESATLKDRVIYKVRIGKFENRSQARKMEIELSGLGYPTKIYP
jgi:tetratricopeptide (TPR) repeat protein